MSVSSYERVQLNARFPAMLLLQDLTGGARNIPLHWHRSLELDLITAGQLTLTVNGRVQTMTAPGLILINSGDLHALTPVSPRIQAITLLVSYDFIKRALPNYDDLFFSVEGRPKLIAELSHVLRLIGQWYRQRTSGYQLLIGSQLYRLLYLLTTQALVGRSTQPTAQCDYRVRATLTTLQTTYQQRIALSDFAHKYQLSTPYFSRLFKREVGLSFRAYLLNLRVEMAQHQLSTTDLKVIDIALANGFGSAQRLISAFEKIYGVAPNQYRRQLDSKAEMDD